jgi:hypothetical protein
MRIGIATDHGGFSSKEQLLSQLREAGHAVVDFGAHHLSIDDDIFLRGKASRTTTWTFFAWVAGR